MKPAPAPPAVSSAANPDKATEHADPDEVDISEHFYKPSTTRRPGASASPAVDPSSLSEAQLRQMMLGFEGPPAGGQQQPPPHPFAGMQGAEDDPIMKMMAQMMAGAGGDGAQNPFAGMPGMPGMPGMQPQAPTRASSAAYAWRLVHALIALSLGMYIAFTTRFSGSKAQRERTAFALAYPAATSDGAELLDEVEVMEEGRETFFWMFATAEALLITTRFIIEGGKPPAEAGIAWTIAGFLSPPWRTRVETALRYLQILSSVRRDILVCVFVLGIAAWVRG